MTSCRCWAVLGSQVFGGFSIRDAGELRIKESEPHQHDVENLRAMGVEVEARDGLTIHKRTQLHGGVSTRMGSPHTPWLCGRRTRREANPKSWGGMCAGFLP